MRGPRSGRSTARVCRMIPAKEHFSLSRLHEKQSCCSPGIRASAEKIPLSKGRASATKNAMLRFVARVLIARQHDLCRTAVEDRCHSNAVARRGKYPPAEPGALGIGPLEAATLNPKLCLLGRRTKYALPTSPRSFIQFFANPENRCLLRIASPLDGVKVSRSSVVKLHFVCVVAHDLRFRRWATAVNVKLILPPRQSRGVSRLC